MTAAKPPRATSWLVVFRDEERTYRRARMCAVCVANTVRGAPVTVQGQQLESGHVLRLEPLTGALPCDASEHGKVRHAS